MTTELWNAKRKKLEAKLVEAALSLSEHTGSHGFAIPVPGTTPAVSVSMSALAASGGNAAPGLTDEQIIKLVYDEFYKGDAGYLCDMFPAGVVAGVRAAISASAPNAALVAALEALEEVGALEDGLLGDDPKVVKAQKMARAALAQAGEVAK